MMSQSDHLNELRRLAARITEIKPRAPDSIGEIASGLRACADAWQRDLAELKHALEGLEAASQERVLLTKRALAKDSDFENMRRRLRDLRKTLLQADSHAEGRWQALKMLDEGFGL